MRPHRRGWLAMFAGLLLAAAPSICAHAQAPGDYNGACPNGAPAREARYCRFFVRYENGGGSLSTIVGDFLGISRPTETRSIGLIIAIDDYPNMPGHNLSAAAVDATRLHDFLVDDQKFDEVIELRNADATAENINYFLEDYLPNHADDYRGTDNQGKARLLIAYSGHGRAQTPTAQAAFILSAATDPEGSVGVYKMTNFTDDVASLATHYFHVLTLINACFGANVFVNGNTGAAATPNFPGSFIITAGSPKNEVQALIPSRGSLFFDLIVSGVTSGEADTQSSQWYMTDGAGAVQSQGRLTLSLPLYTYLSGAFYKINAIQTRSDPHFLTISSPYFGPVQSGMAQGGFFFVSQPQPGAATVALSRYLAPIAPGSPIETASIDEPVGPSRGFHRPGPAGATAPPSAAAEPDPSPTPRAPPSSGGQAPDARLPFGPISSLRGRPDIKIFKPPAIYPIKGYDLSSAEGAIDWDAFSRGPRPQFLYARALGWSGADGSFADRWTHAAKLGIDRGAYLKFNFCRSVDEQVEMLRRVAPPEDAAALPIGVELVTPTADQPQGAGQLACYQRTGVAQARDRILDLARAIETRWGKTPLLMGNSYNLSVLTDDRSDRYMIWLDAYGPQASIADRLKLQGQNPWTIWQHSGSLDAPGVGKKVTGEVFFGTPAQYDLFRSARQNIALSAVK